MRLIMEYDESDGYTYSSTITLPIEYKSKEDAEYDFLVVAEDAHKHQMYEFKWENREFYTHYFFDRENPYDLKNNKIKYYPPQFYTVDEWFEAYKNPEGAYHDTI